MKTFLSPSKFAIELNKINTREMLLKAIVIILNNEVYHKDENIIKILNKKFKYILQSNSVGIFGYIIEDIFKSIFIDSKNISSISYKLYSDFVQTLIESDLNFDNYFKCENHDLIYMIPFITFADIDYLYGDVNTHNINLKIVFEKNYKNLLYYIKEIYELNDVSLDVIEYISRNSTFEDLCVAINKSQINYFINHFNKNEEYYMKHKTAISKIYTICEKIFNFDEKRNEIVDYIVNKIKKGISISEIIDHEINNMNLSTNGNLMENKYTLKSRILGLLADLESIDFNKSIESQEFEIRSKSRSFCCYITNIETASFPIFNEICNYGDLVSIIIRKYFLMKYKNIINIPEYQDKYNKSISLSNIFYNEYKKCINKSNSISYASESFLEGYIIDSPEKAYEVYTKQTSENVQRAQNRIYGAYKTFKQNEGKIESQANKAIIGMKNMLFGNKRKEIIEGKEFTPMGLFKKVIGGLALFSVAPVLTMLGLIVKKAIDKKTTPRERSKIIMELETELTILKEKVEDARAAGDNKAKYILMRQQTELENAIKRIKIGLPANKGATLTAKQVAANNDERIANGNVDAGI